MKKNLSSISRPLRHAILCNVGDREAAAYIEHNRYTYNIDTGITDSKAASTKLDVHRTVCAGFELFERGSGQGVYSGIISTQFKPCDRLYFRPRDHVGYRLFRPLAKSNYDRPFPINSPGLTSTLVLSCASWLHLLLNINPRVPGPYFHFGLFPS